MCSGTRCSLEFSSQHFSGMLDLLSCSFGYVNNEGVNDVYKISVKFMVSQVVQDTFFHKDGYGRLGCQCGRHTRTLLLAVFDQVR